MQSPPSKASQYLWQETKTSDSKETKKMGGETERKTWHGMIDF